jgi:myosin heavy subunit
VFKSEQEVYREEGLKWTFVAYPDNSARLELLEDSSVGVLAVLNEQLRLPKTSDEKFATALYQKCGSHPFFRATKTEIGKSEFTILHYACPVTYQAAGFLDKNRTESPKELYDALKNSSSILMNSLYQASGVAVAEPVAKGSAPERGALGKMGSQRGNMLARAPSLRHKIGRTPSNTDDKNKGKKNTAVGKKVTSLAAQFQSQLTELISKIRATRSHFVCCIKPNKMMKPREFDVPMCTDQLRCGGSLGAIQVFKAGFSNRLSFAAFTKRFSAFAFVSGTNPLTRDLVKAIDRARLTGNASQWRRAAGSLLDIVPLSHTVLSLALNEPPDCEIDILGDIQMGRTQIFLKASAFEFLEKLHLRTRNLTARRLQLRWRAWRVSKHKENRGIKTTSGMIAAQEAMRYFSDWRRIEAMRKVSATIILQRRVRVFLAVQFRKWVLRKIRSLQRGVRRYLKYVREMRRRNNAARLIQHVLRGFHMRSTWLRYRKSVVTLQSQFRGKSTRKRLVRQRNAEARGLWAVLRLQAIYRGNLARAKSQALRRALVCHCTTLLLIGL